MFVVLLTVVSNISKDQLFSTLPATVETLQKETQYPSFGFAPRQIVLDNYTDSLMLNTAYTGNGAEPFKSALFNTRQIISLQEIDQIKNLAEYQEGLPTIESSYERYWHGYLLFLKPLLTFLNYSQIRLVLTTVLFASFCYLLFSVYKKLGVQYSMALLVAGIFTDFFYLGQSIQFVQVYLIGIVMSLFLLAVESQNKKYAIFFITGALTAFFDLLTAPLVTLGFLLIVSTELVVSEKFSLQAVFAQYKKILLHVVLWSVGYASVWISKWVLVDVVYNAGVIEDALGHVLNRTVNKPADDFSYLKVLTLNIQQLIGYSKFSKYCVLILASVCLGIFCVLKKSFKSIFYATVLCLPLLLLPYAWYLFAANHSYLHVWYTYRAQLVTVGAGALLFYSCIDWQKADLLAKSVTKRSGKRDKKIK